MRRELSDLDEGGSELAATVRSMELAGPTVSGALSDLDEPTPLARTWGPDEVTMTSSPSYELADPE